jgi:DNA adenine methylase
MVLCLSITINDFIVLDPPYDLGEKNNTLYGKMGEMHQGFDHDRFADNVKALKGKWMITYNDSEEIRERFKDFKIIDQEYRYFMTFKQDDVGNKTTRIKNELIIINY